MRKYEEILDTIENASSLEELQTSRVLVNNYRMQTGGSNKDLKYQIDVLYATIMNKEKELLRL
jgi:hypothetical protein